MKSKRQKKARFGTHTAILVSALILVTACVDREIKETPIVTTIPPDLGFEFTKGKSLYESNCSTCHGSSLGGVDGKGPPFLHAVYHPGHHSDIAFYRAIAKGVKAHHWQFGNMPPIPTLSNADASEIIAYIREVQRANGIN